MKRPYRNSGSESIAASPPHTNRLTKNTGYLLGGGILFYLVNNVIWLLHDTLPLSWDQSMHAFYSLKYLRLFQSPSTLSLTKILKVTPYWPPFFYVCSVPFTMIFGFSGDAVALTNSVFLLIAVFSIYKIGEYFFGGAAGAGAVLITLLYPIIYALSRHVLIDFALMAMVALAQYLILVSKGGTVLRQSWLLGAAVGCALLTKWTAIAFLLGPGMLLLAMNLREEKKLKKKTIPSLVIFVLALAAVALPWYMKMYGEFKKVAKIALGFDARREGDPTFFWKSFLWYGEAFKDVLISNPLIPFTFLGLLAFILWARTGKGSAFLAAWILPPLLIFIVIPNKDARFIVPLLPAVAILTAAGIRSAPWKAARVSIWALLILVGVYQFYAISFGWPKKIDHYYMHPPLQQDWKIDEILTALTSAYPGQTLRIAILPNQQYFQPNVFKLSAEEKKLPCQIDAVGDRPLSASQLSGYDIFISKTGPIAIEHSAPYRRSFRKEFNVRLKTDNRNPHFILWKTWPLPDGTEALAYLVR